MFRIAKVVYRISVLLSAVCLLAAIPINHATADAADSSTARSADRRWIPSVGLTLGFTTQDHRGSVKTEIQTFVGFAPYAARPPNDNHRSLNLLHVGGNFGLETPRFFRSKWSPRFFIEGHIHNVSSQRRPLARKGDPQSTLTYPQDDPDGVFNELAILGQGSLTTSDAENLQYGAGIGFSIPAQWGDWKIAIKPSVQYLHQEFNFRGIISDVDRIADKPPNYVLLLTAADSREVHAIGPGLEIEVEAVHVKSIVAAVFISGGAYKVLTDTSINMVTEGRRTVDNRLFRGTWTADINPWIYRASVGLRFKWTGR